MTQTNGKDEERPDEKVTVTLPGTVEKIIPPITPDHPEKAQIAIEGAEDFIRKSRSRILFKMKREMKSH
jgi:hypothetical protein